MIRSRLRRPTSKSIIATFCPDWASAAPSAAVEVVLPTPPLPDVTTRTFAILGSPTLQDCCCDGITSRFPGRPQNLFGERRRIELSRFLTQRNEIYSAPVMVTGRLRFRAGSAVFGGKQGFFTNSAGCRWEMKH